MDKEMKRGACWGKGKWLAQSHPTQFVIELQMCSQLSSEQGEIFQPVTDLRFAVSQPDLVLGFTRLQ